MKKYLIVASCEKFEIISDDIQWGNAGLMFLREGQCIAMFSKWDYWMEIE